MNELDYILETHRQEERRIQAICDAIVFAVGFIVGAIIHACCS